LRIRCEGYQIQLRAGLPRPDSNRVGACPKAEMRPKARIRIAHLVPGPFGCNREVPPERRSIIHRNKYRIFPHMICAGAAPEPVIACLVHPESKGQTPVQVWAGRKEACRCILIEIAPHFLLEYTPLRFHVKELPKARIRRCRSRRFDGCRRKSRCGSRPGGRGWGRSHLNLPIIQLKLRPIELIWVI